MAEHKGDSGNFTEDCERVSEVGRKDGQRSGGNLENGPGRASEVSRKGGKDSHGGGRKVGDN